MKKIFLLAAIAFSSLHAQFSISIQGTAATRSDRLQHTITDQSYSTWNNATGVSVHFNLSLTKSLYLSPLIEYSRFRFDRYQDISVRVSPDVYFVPTIKGDDSYRYCYGVELKVVSPGRSFCSLYICSGVVHVIEQLGDVHLNSYWQNERIVANRSKSYFAQTLGIGIESMVLNSVGIDAFMKYYVNYNSGFSRSIGVGVVYVLN